MPMRKVLVVLNSRAGTLLTRDPVAAKRAVQDRLSQSGRQVEVVLAKGRGIRQAIDRGVAGDYDTVVVGGGDGSVSYASRHLAGRDKVLGVLPLGTLNLFARDIGMPADLDEAVAALNSAQAQPVDVGTLNGRPFHTLSGVGFFAQMARAREETRDIPGKLVRTAAAVVRAFGRTDAFAVDLDVDGATRSIQTYALLVTVNYFRGDDWRRSSLRDGTLEIHIAEDQGALAKLKAGADLATGGWRDNPGIHSYQAHKISIARTKMHTWAATDGELSRERVPMTYEIRPAALNLLIPKANAPDASPSS